MPAICFFFYLSSWIVHLCAHALGSLYTVRPANSYSSFLHVTGARQAARLHRDPLQMLKSRWFSGAHAWDFLLA